MFDSGILHKSGLNSSKKNFFKHRVKPRGLTRMTQIVIGVRGGGAGGAAAPPIFRDHGKSGNLCLKSRAI